MLCTLTEEELWSGLDREDAAIIEHVDSCPTCKARAEDLQAGIALIKAQVDENPLKRKLPERVGSYEISGLLGEGGMGMVYEGLQQSPRRAVALKVLRGGPHVDEMRIRLFLREVQTLARLRHPGIAAIYEAGWTQENQPFFVMELVRGANLQEYARELKLTLQQRIELFIRVCQPVAYAHQRGVIHRDLKPSNIFIEATGTPKVLDFGLARIMDQDVNMSSVAAEMGKFMGTLPYMSPEAVRGDVYEVDMRSDIYSLGVVLYELLTGELPLQVRRRRPAEAERVICEEAPRMPKAINRAVKGDLQTIVLKTLEKDPDRRYQTVVGLAEDLQRYLSNQPIIARPPSVLYGLAKLASRHKRTLAYVVSLLILVMGFTFERYRLLLNEKQDKENALKYVALGDVTELVRRARASHETYGDYEKAEQSYRNALSQLVLMDTTPSDRLLTMTRVGLASLLLERGDPKDIDQARELLQQVSVSAQQDAGARPVQESVLLQGLVHLANAQAAQNAGAFPDADADYQAAIETFTHLGGDDPRLLARTKLGLASLLVERSTSEASARARTLLEDIGSTYSEKLRRAFILEADTRELLDYLSQVRQLEYAGRFGSVSRMARHALSLAEERFPADHRHVALARMVYAESLLGKQDAEPATHAGQESVRLERALEQLDQAQPYISRVAFPSLMELKARSLRRLSALQTSADDRTQLQEQLLDTLAVLANEVYIDPGGLRPDAAKDREAIGEWRTLHAMVGESGEVDAGSDDANADRED